MDKISIVVPCFNEQDNIVPFYNAILKVFNDIPATFELMFVDDGSSDETFARINGLHEKDDRVRCISFSRNFGKEAAMYAGLKHTSGDYVIVMDADLQHPPALIPQMVKELEAGHDCAAACRSTRDGEKGLRSLFSSLFYRFSNSMSDVKMPQNAVDFRMMTRQMVDAILSLSEVERFSKGIFVWVGFDTVWIPYENVERTSVFVAHSQITSIRKPEDPPHRDVWKCRKRSTFSALLSSELDIATEHQ